MKDLNDSRCFKEDGCKAVCVTCTRLLFICLIGFLFLQSGDVYAQMPKSEHFQLDVNVSDETIPTPFDMWLFSNFFHMNLRFMYEHAKADLSQE